MAINVAPYRRVRVGSYGIVRIPYLTTAQNPELIGYLNASRCASMIGGVDGSLGLGSQYIQTDVDNLLASMRTANSSYPSALPCTLAPVFIQNGFLVFDPSGAIVSPTADEYDTLFAQYQTCVNNANAGQTGTNVIEFSHINLFLEPNIAFHQLRNTLNEAQRRGLQTWQNAIYTKAKTRFGSSVNVNLQSCGMTTTPGGANPTTATNDKGLITPCNEYASPTETPPMVAGGADPGQFFDRWTPLLLRTQGAPTENATSLERTKHMRSTFGLLKNIAPYVSCGQTWVLGSGDWVYWGGTEPPAADLVSIEADAAMCRDDELVDFVMLFPILYTTNSNTTAYEVGLNRFFTVFHYASQIVQAATGTLTAGKIIAPLLHQRIYGRSR